MVGGTGGCREVGTWIIEGEVCGVVGEHGIVDDEVAHGSIGCRSLAHLIILVGATYAAEESPYAVYVAVGIACAPCLAET